MENGRVQRTQPDVDSDYDKAFTSNEEKNRSTPLELGFATAEPYLALTQDKKHDKEHLTCRIGSTPIDISFASCAIKAVRLDAAALDAGTLRFCATCADG